MAIYRLLVAAIISSTSILLTPFRLNIALAQLAPEEINKIAKPITVRIDGVGQGSGVIVGKENDVYTVVTNWHVVKVLGNYTVQTVDGEKHSVDYRQVREFPNSVDLAIIEFSSDNDYEVATIGDSELLGEGQTIHLAGYPGSGQIIGESDRYYRFNSLSINAILPDNREGGYSLSYGGENFSGMSGSPILDSNGDVIGINGTAYVDFDGKARCNYAIPINTYKELVSVVEQPQPKSEPNSLQNIATASNLSTVDTLVDEKLNPIPVFSILDENGAPLVANQDDGSRTAGVFISQKDADKFIIQLKIEQPELGAKVKIVPVSLAEVNRFSREEKLDFDYIPNEIEVNNAKDILFQNGGEYENGVPLFVGRSKKEKSYLTFDRGEQQVIPFFFDLSQLEELVAKVEAENSSLAGNIYIEVVMLKNVINSLENSDNNQVIQQLVLVPTKESIQFLQSAK